MTRLLLTIAASATLGACSVPADPIATRANTTQDQTAADMADCKRRSAEWSFAPLQQCMRSKGYTLLQPS
jgi:hypothetical protein